MANYKAEDRVSVWLGTFPGERAFAKYLEEVWPEDEDEDTPVRCDFWRDLGISWHDHDFQEAHFESAPVPLPDLIRSLSWSDSYRDGVLRAGRERGLERAGAVVVIFEYDFPLEAGFTSEHLVYLGSFAYSTGGPPMRRG